MTTHTTSSMPVMALTSDTRRFNRVEGRNRVVEFAGRDNLVLYGTPVEVDVMTRRLFHGESRGTVLLSRPPAGETFWVLTAGNTLAVVEIV